MCAFVSDFVCVVWLGSGLFLQEKERGKIVLCVFWERKNVVILSSGF